MFYSYLLLLKEKKTEKKQDLAKKERNQFLNSKLYKKLISKIQHILSLQYFVHNVGISYLSYIL